MSCLLASRASWRRHLHLSYRGIFLGVLLATQALVPALLADQNYYVLSSILGRSSLQVFTDSGTGTAVRLEDGATLATCAHVVSTNRWVKVEIDHKMVKALVLATDPQNDVAILRIDKKYAKDPLRVKTGLPEVDTLIMVNGKTQNDVKMKAKAGRLRCTFPGPLPNLVVDLKPIFGYSGGPAVDSDGNCVGLVKGYVYMGDFTGTEVIRIEHVLELIQRTRENLSLR